MSTPHAAESVARLVLSAMQSPTNTSKPRFGTGKRTRSLAESHGQPDAVHVVVDVSARIAWDLVWDHTVRAMVNDLRVGERGSGRARRVGRRTVAGHFGFGRQISMSSVSAKSSPPYLPLTASPRSRPAFSTARASSLTAGNLAPTSLVRRRPLSRGTSTSTWRPLSDCWPSCRRGRFEHR